jgi:hypothetical protein
MLLDKIWLPNVGSIMGSSFVRVAAQRGWCNHAQRDTGLHRKTVIAAMVQIMCAPEMQQPPYVELWCAPTRHSVWSSADAHTPCVLRPRLLAGTIDVIERAANKAATVVVEDEIDLVVRGRCRSRRHAATTEPRSGLAGDGTDWRRGDVCAAAVRAGARCVPHAQEASSACATRSRAVLAERDPTAGLPAPQILFARALADLSARFPARQAATALSAPQQAALQKYLAEAAVSGGLRSGAPSAHGVCRSHCAERFRWS